MPIGASASFGDAPAPGALPGAIADSGAAGHGAGAAAPILELTRNLLFNPVGELKGAFAGVSEARVMVRARRWMEQLEHGEARTQRFAMLSFLRARLPGASGSEFTKQRGKRVGQAKPEFRTKECMAHLAYDREFLELRYSSKEKRASFNGLALCGAVWVCPVCSEKITRERGRELKRLLALADKYLIVMVTYTVEHHQGEALAPMVDGINGAIRGMKQNRVAWERFKAKWAIIGHVYALEVTYGKNGWHPHRHEMLVIDREKLGISGPAAKQLFESEMQAELYSMYHRQLNRVGLDCDEEHGVQVSANRREYGDYISKWGASEELTRSVYKQASGGGRSVWELLRESVLGDAKAWELFLEYARAFKGKKQLHWSKGLRALLELPLQEMTDEEAAKLLDLEEYKPVLLFSRQGLYYLRDKDLYGPVLEFAELVNGDRQQLIDYLARMGLRKFVIAGKPDDS